MKNAIIWSPSLHKLFAECIWETFKSPFMLTFLNNDWFIGYYNKDFPSPLEDLYGYPQYNTKWEVKSNPQNGNEDWRLIQPCNLESFTDLVRISYDSDDLSIIFSSDTDIKGLYNWIEKREHEKLKNRRLFLPEFDFEENTNLITNFSKCTILHGFLTYHDNYDYLFVSDDIKFLNKIMKSAVQAGEPRLPDYTDSLSFKKSYDDSAIFFTDLDLVIKNRLKYKDQ